MSDHGRTYNGFEGFENVVERETTSRERNQRDSLTAVISLGGWKAGRRAA